MIPEELAVLAVQQLERDRMDMWHREEILRRQASALAKIVYDPRVRAVFRALDDREYRSMKEICELVAHPFGNGGHVSEWRRIFRDSEPLLVSSPVNIGGPQLFLRTKFGSQFLREIEDLERRAPSR